MLIRVGLRLVLKSLHQAVVEILTQKVFIHHGCLEKLDKLTLVGLLIEILGDLIDNLPERVTALVQFAEIR